MKKIILSVLLWNVIYRPVRKGNPAPPTPPQPHYLTFTAQEVNSAVGFYCYNETEDPENPLTTSLQYSTDNGETWEDYELVHTGDKSETVMIDLENIGDKVMFRGNNPYFSQAGSDSDLGAHIECVATGMIAASGDVTSLLNTIGGDIALTPDCFYSMFSDCTSLTTAPVLPATTLADNCYDHMFSGCTSLTTAPNLPATTLADYCYDHMFLGCTSLTTAPVLPATTLADNCYNSMFSGCTSLTTAPDLPATTLAVSCYENMFSGCTSLATAPNLPATTLADNCYDHIFLGCTSLTTAPVLPATTLADNCYNSMFNGCTSLTTAPVLPATTLADNCYSYMFSDCTRIEEFEFQMLNTSNNVFQNCSNAIHLKVRDFRPPTIGSNTITGLAANCKILVPDSSVADYKHAQYWSERVDYIEAFD